MILKDMHFKKICPPFLDNVNDDDDDDDGGGGGDDDPKKQACMLWTYVPEEDMGNRSTKEPNCFIWPGVSQMTGHPKCSIVKLCVFGSGAALLVTLLQLLLVIAGVEQNPGPAKKTQLGWDKTITKSHNKKSPNKLKIMQYNCNGISNEVEEKEHFMLSNDNKIAAIKEKKLSKQNKTQNS